MLKRIKKKQLVGRLKAMSLPGFGGVSIWEIIVFFFEGLVNGAVTTRGAAIAYSFFLAIFPLMLFFFSLIAYVPIDGFQVELLSLLEEVLPQNAFLAMKETIEETVLKQRFDLLSVGFISMLIFATNGLNSLYSAFSATYHTFQSRGVISQYLISMMLVAILSILIITGVGLAIFGKAGMQLLVSHHLINEGISYQLLFVGQWIVILFIFLIAVAIIFYFAPNKRGKFKIFSAGSSLATVLMLLSSWGFSYYINNFGQYNKLYGSIGTVMVILVWLYANAISLLIGFELNISITNVGKRTCLVEKEKSIII